MRETVAKALERVINRGLTSQGYQGLCTVLAYSTTNVWIDSVGSPVKNRNHLREWLENNFRSWPEFSGDIEYPVPSFIENVSANLMYNDNPLYMGEYGESRLRLAAHLLDNIGSLPE